ncbi:DUF2796 domain-containing protein [Aquabacterium sp. OR-4]|uniref:DUF2796 domain-containing protein n=1 Tax=Aquabacterium sp. OR-4 TaxID=2978127 RepID=UPI0021B482AA|nr:DUF2796 domain-containing protein [Aquabacterium sp. OR-4]MDT7835346.1 DUF2796 domain-containing protein [Aquabacterium sp. OR-4]
MSHRLLNPWAAALLIAPMLATQPALAAGKAHEHGTLKLDVAIDGAQLSVALEVPLDNLLGFERAPRNEAERKAAGELLARLRAPGQGPALFAPDAAAQCTLARAEVNAPVLVPAGHEPTRPRGATASATGSEHADLDASYTYSCAQPAALRKLDIGLFEVFQRLQRIDVQLAGPQGQAKSTLKRPQRRVQLAR